IRREHPTATRGHAEALPEAAKGRCRCRGPQAMNFTLNFCRDLFGCSFLGRVLPSSAGRFIYNGSKASQEFVADATRGKRGLVLLSGYNTSSKGAQASYETIV